jgi:hypothetical protein
MVRKTCSWRGQAKAKSKATPAAEKPTKKRRGDKAFAVAMNSTLTDVLHDDTTYVHTMIDSNPVWVPWLKKLFASGRMSRFVADERLDLTVAEPENSDDSTLGPQVNLKVPCIVKLAKSDLYSFYKAVRSNLPPFDEIELAWLRAAVKFDLHINEESPWPTESKSRHVRVLAALAKERARLTGNRLADADVEEWKENNIFDYFSVEAGSVLVYKCRKTRHSLPINPEKEGVAWQWRLLDASDFGTDLISDEMPGMILKPGKLCHELLDFKDAWSSTWQSCKALAPVAASGAASSSSDFKSPVKVFNFKLSPSAKAKKT